MLSLYSCYFVIKLQNECHIFYQGDESYQTRYKNWKKRKSVFRSPVSIPGMKTWKIIFQRFDLLKRLGIASSQIFKCFSTEVQNLIENKNLPHPRKFSPEISPRHSFFTFLIPTLFSQNISKKIWQHNQIWFIRQH